MALTIPRAGALLAALALSGALPLRTDAAADDVAAAIAAAIAVPDRPAEHVAHDAERRPEAVLAFAGVKPGDRVADFMSGGGYFTRLFSHIVGSTGHVYAFLPDEQLRNCSADEVAGTRALEHSGAHANISGAHANIGGAYANPGGAYASVSVLTGPVSRFHPPEPVDVVWTSLNFHDLYDSFMGPADVPQVVRAMLEALKPGGELIVIDHAAEAGSGVRDTETLHRIDPDVILRAAAGAGFRLEARSEVLRNPQDPHQLPVFDPAVRWRTDQVILKFRKSVAAASGAVPTGPAAPAVPASPQSPARREGFLCL